MRQALMPFGRTSLIPKSAFVTSKKAVGRDQSAISTVRAALERAKKGSLIRRLEPLLKASNLIGVVGVSPQAPSLKLTHVNCGLLPSQQMRSNKQAMMVNRKTSIVHGAVLCSQMPSVVKTGICPIFGFGQTIPPRSPKSMACRWTTSRRSPTNWLRVLPESMKTPCQVNWPMLSQGE